MDEIKTMRKREEPGVTPGLLELELEDQSCLCSGQRRLLKEVLLSTSLTPTH